MGVRPRIGGGVALAAVLALMVVVPAVQAAEASAERVEGDVPILARAEQGHVLVRPGASMSGQLTVQASWIDATVVDVVSKTVQVPHPEGGMLKVLGNAEQTWRNSTHADSRVEIRDILQSDAEILVKPISEDVSATVDHDGRFAVSRVDDEVLVDSHFVDNFTESEFYYEHRVRDALNLTLQGDTTVEVEGDFLLYAWGSTVEIQGERPREIRTGHHVESNTADANVHREDHYVRAEIELHDARLTLSLSDESSRLYGQQIDATVDGTARLVEPTGDLGIPKTVGDGTRLPDGTYRLAPDGQGVEIAAPAAPASGAAARLPGGSLPVALAALFAVGIVGYASPNLYARWTRGDDPPGSWSERRAQGYLRMGLRADARGRHRLALWCLDRSVTWNPDDPATYVTRAIVAREAGRSDDALRDHRRAHRHLRSLDDGMAAHNAFEAARTAARSDRPDEVHAWIRLAAERDVDVLEMAMDDPDLVSVLSEGPPRSSGDDPRTRGVEVA